MVYFFYYINNEPRPELSSFEIHLFLPEKLVVVARNVLSFRTPTSLVHLPFCLICLGVFSLSISATSLSRGFKLLLVRSCCRQHIPACVTNISSQNLSCKKSTSHPRHQLLKRQEQTNPASEYSIPLMYRYLTFPPVKCILSSVWECMCLRVYV